MSANNPTTQQAFLISMVNTGEHDSLVRFYCRSSGAVTVKARGIRKPTSKLGPRLKQADELQLRLAGRGKTPVLSGVATEFDNQAWREQMNRLALVWFMLECAWLTSAEEESNDQVFHLIANLLRAGPMPQGLNSAACTFALKFLKLQGLQPDLEHCVVDGHRLEDDEPVHLAPNFEGLVGRVGYNTKFGSSSQSAVPLNSEDIGHWRMLMDVRLADCLQLSCSKYGTSLAIYSTVNLIEQACGQRLRTLEFLSQQWKLKSLADLAAQPPAAPAS